MTDWKRRLNGDPLPWLLEPDPAQPAVRYFTLRDILGMDEDDREIKEARKTIMSAGPVPVILDAQEKDGYWVKPGAGYSPKYCGTVWQVIFLAQLGADGADRRVHAAGEYILNHTVGKHGGFTYNGTSSTFIHCLAGNLGAALQDLGFTGDPRLQAALEWQSRVITGEGIAGLDSKDAPERYYAYTPGPLFRCGPNGGLPCAWGAVKAMLALSRVPRSLRTGVIDSATKQGTDFLLSYNPATADYPFGFGDKPSSSWFKFGYPLGYVADVLQNLEALASLGQINHARVAPALELLLGKQSPDGRWKMQYSYNGKMWIDIEKNGQPSKWVTLRALRVLKSACPE